MNSETHNHNQYSHDEWLYPTITRRYLATFIDGLFILLSFLLISSLLQSEHQLIIGLRVIIIVLLAIFYEPFCTSKFCTIGQWIMKVRIRNYYGHDRISLFRAYLRLLTKVFLGILIFFSIPFNKHRRGIHDFAAISVVLNAEALKAT